MTARQLVPGIAQYPELEKQLEQRLDMGSVGPGKCAKCLHANLAREFRQKLQTRVERDKLMRRR